MLGTWVSLRYIWVISHLLTLPLTLPLSITLRMPQVFLLDLPYPMPLIGLFNFVAGFAAEVFLSMFSLSHLITYFLIQEYLFLEVS